MRSSVRASSLLLAGLFLAGCASSSIASDVDAVARLSSAPQLPEIGGTESEETERDLRRSLLSRPLDAEDAVKLALMSNRELRARLFELGIERGELIEAGTIANPQLEFELLPERDSALELRVEYDLASLLLAPLRARVADSKLEAERHRLAGEVIQLGFEVRSAFYALAAEEERLELAKAVLETFALERDTAAALLAAGNTNARRTAETLSAHADAQVEAAAFELAVFERREALQRLLGLHGPDTTWTSRGRLSPLPSALPSFDRVETRAIEASHDLAALRSSLDAVSKATQVTRTEGWLPELQVDVHALLARGEAGSAIEEERTWQLGAGLSIGLPIFDRQQGRLVAQEAELSALAERVEGFALELRSATRRAAAQLRFHHTRAKHYEERIQPAEANLTAETLLQYNAMQLDVFELLEQRRHELERQIESVGARRDYWVARAAFDAHLAGRRVTLPENTEALGGD